MMGKRSRDEELIPRTFWWVLLGLGLIASVTGLSLAVIYGAVVIEDAPGGVALPFVDEYPTVVEMLLPSMAAFFIGGCLTFVGELLRRGTIFKGKNTNVAIFRPLKLPIHLAWVLGAAAAWATVMFAVLPWAVKSAPQGPGWSSLDADSDATFVIGVYGGLAALLTGALLGSLFKKAWYLAAVRRLGTPATTSLFWWNFSAFWRADVWLVALGGMFLGLSPLAMTFGSAVSITATVGGGSVLIALGLCTCTQYRRSGMPLGTGSSLSGEYKTLLSS
ncbi:hypothetical protein [Microbacterium sp. TWP3-1-2b2]|uniref:hypothetical protein n=1 Tax=Microbacterium sp. TWP3-1-2b2 TaxID=2804651 RepID=UPI003CF51305